MFYNEKTKKRKGENISVSCGLFGFLLKALNFRGGDHPLPNTHILTAPGLLSIFQTEPGRTCLATNKSEREREKGERVTGGK